LAAEMAQLKAGWLRENLNQCIIVGYLFWHLWRQWPLWEKLSESWSPICEVMTLSGQLCHRKRSNVSVMWNVSINGNGITSA
jgi:hypothetical protein